MREDADADWKSPIDGALEEFAARARSGTRQAGVDAAAAEAVGALETAGADPLVLKGVALARTLYRVHEVRSYFDVDLLVAPSQLAIAGGVLADLGYSRVSELQGVDDVAGILHAEVWARSVPGFGNQTIDLHWQLDGCRAPPENAWTTLSTRRTLINLSGRSVSTLDRSGLALHLALHAAQHGTDDLKAVGDLRRGLERWPNEAWRDAAQLATDLDATEAFAAGLRLVPAGAALAADLALPDADALLWAIANRDARPRGTFHVRALTEARGLRERVGLVRRALFPPRAWILWEHRWAAGGRNRLLAAYAIHILRSPLWAVRAWRFRRRAERQAD